MRGSGGRARPELRRGRRTPESLEEAGSPRKERTARPDPRKGGSGRGRPPAGRDKRTSRNSDDKNPTRSGIQYPSPRYRTRGEVEAPAAPPGKPSLRKVRRGPNRGDLIPEKPKRARKVAPTKRRRGQRATEASEELRQIAGRGATRAVQELGRAAEAVNQGHERDAARILRPLRDA
ncbi:MAG TPA: hypothetical protein VH092_00860, partial [Urbifossiella sp.]|nr:hypothetical protein [Urbifossiella sp.]